MAGSSTVTFPVSRSVLSRLRLRTRVKSSRSRTSAAEASYRVRHPATPIRAIVQAQLLARGFEVGGQVRGDGVGQAA